MSKYGYFLRIFELKNKYCRLTVKNKDEQNLVRQLSSCLVGKYSAFTQICLEYKKKQKKLFKPIDIIYKPAKHIEIEPLCFFSNDLSKAYSSSYSLGEKKGCSAHTKFTSVIIVINFFIELAKQERHRKNCSGITGVVYNFNNHNLISYQDNFNAKGNVPYVYFDFETTAPTFNFADPEQKKIFVVSYVMIVAFHPKLNLDRIIIQRKYAHSLEQLTTLNYFTREELSFPMNRINN